MQCWRRARTGRWSKQYSTCKARHVTVMCDQGCKTTRNEVKAETTCDSQKQTQATKSVSAKPNVRGTVSYTVCEGRPHFKVRIKSHGRDMPCHQHVCIISHFSNGKNRWAATPQSVWQHGAYSLGNYSTHKLPKCHKYRDEQKHQQKIANEVARLQAWQNVSLHYSRYEIMQLVLGWLKLVRTGTDKSFMCFSF